MSTKWHRTEIAAAETQVSSLTEGLIFPASTWRSAVQQGSRGVTPVCRLGHRFREQPVPVNLACLLKNNSHYITACLWFPVQCVCVCVWQEKIDGEDRRLTTEWLQEEQKLRSVKESGTRCGNRFNLMLPPRLLPLFVHACVLTHSVLPQLRGWLQK